MTRSSSSMLKPNLSSMSSAVDSCSYTSSSFPRRTEEATNNHEREETDSYRSIPSYTAHTLRPNFEDNHQSTITSLLHLSFNQDYRFFSVGTNQGFLLYNCDPYRETQRRIFNRGGGIRIVEMLFQCNVIVLVGDGSDPHCPTNKVMIWDDHRSRFVGEKSFQSEVLSVRLRRDRIIVVLKQKIFVHNFEDFRVLHEIETFENRKGLCEVSQGSGLFVLVFPGLMKGEVKVEHYGSKRRSVHISAHDSSVACFGLSQDGKLLATASIKGTLIRIYSTSGALLQEVRRGTFQVDIYSLSFSPTGQYLAVTSDKNTVHIFNLNGTSGPPKTDKSRSISGPNLATTLTTSSLSFIKGMLLPKYFSSECARSVCQFRLRECPRYIVAFGREKNTIVILGMDGSYYKCEFDPVNGGEMTQLEYHNLLSPKETF